mmetsp:Transcript_55791/g.130723  ORF Transcript_55791/g.130723 Transcript_55791/m.130723 type:complete len:232 (-) Transcript_55791:383-1078(-)
MVSVLENVSASRLSSALSACITPSTCWKGKALRVRPWMVWLRRVLLAMSMTMRRLEVLNTLSRFRTTNDTVFAFSFSSTLLCCATRSRKSRALNSYPAAPGMREALAGPSSFLVVRYSRLKSSVSVYLSCARSFARSVSSFVAPMMPSSSCLSLSVDKDMLFSREYTRPSISDLSSYSFTEQSPISLSPSLSLWNTSKSTSPAMLSVLNTSSWLNVGLAFFFLTSVVCSSS